MADLEPVKTQSNVGPSQQTALSCPLPLYQEKDNFLGFLASAGSGSLVGTGVKLEVLGSYVPHLRVEYEKQLAALKVEAQLKLNDGQSLEEVANWATTQRKHITETIRNSEGFTERFVENLRDSYQYAEGGRSKENIITHYAKRATSEAELNELIIQGASKPNTRVSKFASLAAHYFKNGGRAVLALGAGLTTYEIASAKPEDRERVIYEQAGGFAGGYAVSGGAAYGCFLFGVTTGWGLIGCALLGGVAGGVGGGAMGDMLYFAKRPEIEREIKDGVLDFSAVSPVIPYPKINFNFLVSWLSM